MRFDPTMARRLLATDFCVLGFCALMALYEFHHRLMNELGSPDAQGLADSFQFIKDGGAQPDVDLLGLKSLIVGFLRHLQHGGGSYQNRQGIHHSAIKCLLLLSFAVSFMVAASMIRVSQSLRR
jgi:hypothetical protein